MARNYDPLQEWEDYVPNVTGDDGANERDRFGEDPDGAIVVEIKTLSKRERERYGDLAERSKRQGIVAAEKQLRSMMGGTVRNVRNYSKDGQAILTGEDLSDLGDQDICMDIMIAVMSRPALERGLAKKLRSRSATPNSPPMKKSDGGAVDAANELSQDGRLTQIPMTPNSSSTTPPNAGSGTATVPGMKTSTGDGPQG